MNLSDLIVRSLTDPRAVAQELIALNLQANILWMALILFTLLNAIIYSGINLLLGDPELVPFIFRTPWVVTAILLGGVVFSTYAFQLAGQMLGGKGGLRELLTIMAWLQVLRLVVLLAQLVLSVILPPLGALVVIFAFFAGIWIVLNFIVSAHQFDDIGPAIGTVAIGFGAIVFALVIILALMGVQPESIAHV